MNVNGVLFIIQFIIVLGITLCKIYNIFNKGEWYDIKMSFILYISFFFAYITGFVVMLLDPERLIYVSLIQFESWFIALQTLFLLFELFFHGSKTTVKTVEAYKSTDKL